MAELVNLSKLPIPNWARQEIQAKEIAGKVAKERLRLKLESNAEFQRRKAMGAFARAVQAIETMVPKLMEFHAAMGTPIAEDEARRRAAEMQLKYDARNQK